MPILGEAHECQNTDYLCVLVNHFRLRVAQECLTVQLFARLRKLQHIRLPALRAYNQLFQRR